MKIEKQKKVGLKIALTVIVLLFLIGGSVYAYSLSHESKKEPAGSSSVNLSPATNNEKTAGDEAKSSSANSDNTSSDSTKNTSSTTTTTPSSVGVHVSASSQNGSTYQLRYLIDSVVDNANCTLTLTQGSKTVTKSADTQALAQSSTCEGFDIPTSSLSSGAWQASMVVSGSNVTGSTISTIEVQQ